MNSLTLIEAAKFLRIHPVTLGEKARTGEIPGAKVGKCWVFIDIDILEYLRSKYPQQSDFNEQQRRSKRCHFSNATTRASGGSKLPLMDAQYNAVLGLKTKMQPKSSTIG